MGLRRREWGCGKEWGFGMEGGLCTRRTRGLACRAAFSHSGVGVGRVGGIRGRGSGQLRCGGGRGGGGGGTEMLVGVGSPWDSGGGEVEGRGD